MGPPAHRVNETLWFCALNAQVHAGGSAKQMLEMPLKLIGGEFSLHTARKYEMFLLWYAKLERYKQRPHPIRTMMIR